MRGSCAQLPGARLHRRAAASARRPQPRCSSQDLNAIELAWREVRARLAATEPTAMESRDKFIVRLRAAAPWVNLRRQACLLKICTDQKEMARDVMKMKGGRTKH